MKNVFENKQSDAIFLTVNDYTKNELKKEFIKDALLLNNVSKKAIKYVCQNSSLKNLLEGNVLLAQSKQNPLDYKKIIAHKKVNLHFYFSNQQIYRNREKVLTTNATPTAFYNQLNFASKTLLKTLYLIQKHNQNSIY